MVGVPDRQAQLELLLDRYEQPTHRGALPSPALQAEETNPRCGDVVRVFAEIRDDRLARVRFEGGGCTLSQVAADLTAELAEGKLVSEAQRLDLAQVQAALGPDVGRARPDCAMLGLRALQRALAPMLD